MTAPADPDVGEIARGLSKAMKRALTEHPLLSDGRAMAETLTRTTRNNLRSMGLTRYYSAAFDCLTPLGLAVRQHLTERSGK